MDSSQQLEDANKESNSLELDSAIGIDRYSIDTKSTESEFSTLEDENLFQNTNYDDSFLQVPQLDAILSNEYRDGSHRGATTRKGVLATKFGGTILFSGFFILILAAVYSSFRGKKDKLDKSKESGEKDKLKKPTGFVDEELQNRLEVAEMPFPNESQCSVNLQKDFAKLFENDRCRI